MDVYVYGSISCRYNRGREFYRRQSKSGPKDHHVTITTLLTTLCWCTSEITLFTACDGHSIGQWRLRQGQHHCTQSNPSPSSILSERQDCRCDRCWSWDRPCCSASICRSGRKCRNVVQQQSRSGWASCRDRKRIRSKVYV